MVAQERRISELEERRGMKNRNVADGMLMIAMESAKAQADRCWKVFVENPTSATMSVFVEAYSYYNRLNDALKSHRRRVQGTNV